MGVPAILCAENWDDHDRSHRYMARDIGWNYLMSTLPNSIILNYGDNDTFPLWNNQEVYGVRPDVRIMNTSYLGGEWYIDEMKTRANDAAGIPFSLPKHKYTYMNDWVPVSNRIDRPVELKGGDRLHPQRRPPHAAAAGRWHGRWRTGRLHSDQATRATGEQGECYCLGHSSRGRPRQDGRYDLLLVDQECYRQKPTDVARHAGPLRLETAHLR